MRETQEMWVHPWVRKILGSGTPCQYVCLDNPMDRGIWESIVHMATEEWDTTQREKKKNKCINESLCFIPESNTTLNSNCVSVKINLKKNGMTEHFTLSSFKSLGFLSLWIRTSQPWHRSRIQSEVLYGQWRWCEALSYKIGWLLGNATVNEWLCSHNTRMMIKDITEGVSGTGHRAYSLLHLRAVNA